MAYATDKSLVSMSSGVMNHKNIREATNCRAMTPYMTVSANLLKGSWPLPSWAWAAANADSKANLDRNQRKSMLTIHEFQDASFKNLNKLIKKLNLTKVSSLETSHSTVFFACGSWEIGRLFNTIPKLIAIRDDSTTVIDILSHTVRRLSLTTSLGFCGVCTVQVALFGNQPGASEE